MSIEDRYDAVRELIVMGKQRGYLLYDEINDSLPEGVYSADELDSIFSLFGSADIDIIDPEQEFQSEGVKGDNGDEGNGATENRAALSLLADSTISPERHYFREMASFRLLNRQGEIEIAKRIERGKGVVLRALSRSPLAVREILRIGNQLKDGQISIRDIVAFGEDELTDALLEEKTKSVLSIIESIRKHEQAAQRVSRKIKSCRKNSLLYKKHLSMLARY